MCWFCLALIPPKKRKTPQSPNLKTPQEITRKYCQNVLYKTSEHEFVKLSPLFSKGKMRNISKGITVWKLANECGGHKKLTNKKSLM